MKTLIAALFALFIAGPALADGIVFPPGVPSLVGVPLDLGTINPNYTATGAVSVGLSAYLSEPVRGKNFGLVNDPSCTIDQTVPLQNFINASAGTNGYLERGTYCLKTATSTLKVTAPYTRLSGASSATIIKWAAPTGTAIAPIIDWQASAVNGSMWGIGFDHNAAAGGYTDSTYFGTDPWGDVAVSIQADYFSGTDLWGQNGFDNCFGVSQLSSNAPVRGKPQFWTLRGIHTTNCGTGNHSSAQGGPGKIGAGVDIGSGSAGSGSDWIDNGSYGSFILDIGAGAAGNSVTNITSFYSKVDQKLTVPALYVGDANNNLANVSIIQPAKNGVWFDKYAVGLLVSNLDVKAPAGACATITTPAKIANFHCSDASYGNTGQAAAVVLDTSPGTIDGLSITGLDITNALATPSASIITLGTNNINGLIEAQHLPGANSETAIGSSVTGLMLKKVANGAEVYYNAAGPQLHGVAVANLPACSTGTTGMMALVVDATSPTYNTALTGGGAIRTLGLCNGTAWVAH